MDSKIHPAITVTNVKNFIPITLEMESGHYSSWSEVFKIHCRAFLVIDHLSPKPATVVTPSSSKEGDKDKTPPPADDSWDRIDAIVLQWIYDTISNDLLHTILKPNTTACEAWNALANIFQDNKNTRAVYLSQKAHESHRYYVYLFLRCLNNHRQLREDDLDDVDFDPEFFREDFTSPFEGLPSQVSPSPSR
ncbi:hypothetical protein L1987_10315 [Smallanthus sonchifolius]|uniref:Uncharacterized protein n=1 Tax=Smallanthus sonchifolius TaxID=185202 RepID=A0ACB9JRR9_9ASTR|nr:hypothetical protein L1987_10315 [Smallanthus sonchifolius]